MKKRGNCFFRFTDNTDYKRDVIGKIYREIETFILLI